jgi:hypothetical protein
MKIEFSDKSSVECRKSDNGNVVLIIRAKDYDYPLKKITNAVEITMEEFKRLISEI